MSSGFNQAILLGRPVAPPEELKSKSGKSYVRAVVAETVYSKTSEDVNEERTSFIPVTIFGRQAEVFSKYVQKGDLVHLVGRLDSREWTAESGEKRLTLGLVVEQLHLLPNERRNADTDAGEVK
jgi:single-strand DNA-binding protein